MEYKVIGKLIIYVEAVTPEEAKKKAYKVIEEGNYELYLDAQVE